MATIDVNGLDGVRAEMAKAEDEHVKRMDRFKREEQRLLAVERIVSLGVSRDDAVCLVHLSDETRTRILLDGKSI